MAEDKTKKPVKKAKEPTKEQKEKRKVWLAMYRTAQVDFYMKAMATYGLQMDKRMCLVAVVFLSILAYTLPDAKTFTQMYLWVVSALAYFLCLVAMIINTKYSMVAAECGLKHLCAYKKLKKDKKKIKKTDEESVKAFNKLASIDGFGFAFLLVGTGFFFAYIISVFNTGGF